MFISLAIILSVFIGFTPWCIWRILPFPAWGKWLAVLLYVIFFAAVFIHFKFEDRMPQWLATATYEAGTSWMIFFVYAMILFAVLYLGRLAHIVPESFLHNSLAGTCTVGAIIAAILVYGNIHYHHKYRQPIEITTQKTLKEPLTVVLASDLHVGYHNRRAELARWINIINSERPDLVLFAGDIIDGSMRPVREGQYYEEFRRLDAPVYACLGNHEYISGRSGSEAFYSDAGITLLRDSAALEHGIRIVGRDDRSNESRAELAALAPRDSIFTILLDHQPVDLEQAEQAGIDFQFSGHTHHGQIWPGNWITNLIFDVAYGPAKRGETQYYVTSGLGLWGGKFRIGTRSEYVVLKIHN